MGRLLSAKVLKSTKGHPAARRAARRSTSGFKGGSVARAHHVQGGVLHRQRVQAGQIPHRGSKGRAGPIKSHLRPPVKPGFMKGGGGISIMGHSLIGGGGGSGPKNYLQAQQQRNYVRDVGKYNSAVSRNRYDANVRSRESSATKAVKGLESSAAKTVGGKAIGKFRPASPGQVRRLKNWISAKPGKTYKARVDHLHQGYHLIRQVQKGLGDV